MLCNPNILLHALASRYISPSPIERTEQLNLRTLACVQWDECFITIMYKGTLALDTAAFWSAYISRKTPACTAAKYC